MSRKTVYYGPRNKEIHVSEEILKTLAIKEGSRVSDAEYARIRNAIMEAGQNTGLFKKP